MRPALARGEVVVTDRYVDSTLAYQGAGRDSTLAELERVARWATGDLRPHLTVLLDLDPAPGLARFDRARPHRGRVDGVPPAGPRGFLGWRRPTPTTTWCSTPAAPVDEIAAAVRRGSAAARQVAVRCDVTVWDGLVGQRAVVERLQRAAGRRRHDPRLAVHRTARVGPLQRRDRLRRGAAVRAGRVRGVPRRAAPCSPAPTPTSR